MGRLGTTLNLQLFLWNNFPILLHLTRELRLHLLYLPRIHTGIHHLPVLSFPLYPFYHPSVLSSYRMSYHQPWIHIQQPLFLSLQLPVIMSQFSFSSYFSSRSSFLIKTPVSLQYFSSVPRVQDLLRHGLLLLHVPPLSSVLH